MNKYQREIKPGVCVDVYDVLAAWRVQNPALQHLVKKALQPGERGHKSLLEDLHDILSAAGRAIELEERRLEILGDQVDPNPMAPALGAEVLHASR